MQQIRKIYIHQQSDWPDLYWDTEVLIALLGEVRNLQGRLLGKMGSLGFSLQGEAQLGAVSMEVLKSNEIEGAFLNVEEVRSSVARQLGLDFSTKVDVSRNVDGLVEMMIDATKNHTSPLTEERLFSWHAALFPTGRSGIHPITVGDWRKDDKGPMQVVSGALGKERVHFEAPDSNLVAMEMHQFLEWLNGQQPIDPVIKAGVAHLWYLTIHPFDDGNGRMARAITDLLLARSDQSPQRFYSMSAQILDGRNAYYEALEKTQQGKLDITMWLYWFLNCLKQSIRSSEDMLSHVMVKAEFWRRHRDTLLNERQQKMIHRLFGDFFGNLSTSKWAKMCKCSSDTALRDIQDLIKKKVLKQDDAGGRSTTYRLLL